MQQYLTEFLILAIQLSHHLAQNHWVFDSITQTNVIDFIAKKKNLVALLLSLKPVIE